jgi:hypothetical protein
MTGAHESGAPLILSFSPSGRRDRGVAATLLSGWLVLTACGSSTPDATAPSGGGAGRNVSAGTGGSAASGGGNFGNSGGGSGSNSASNGGATGTGGSTGGGPGAGGSPGTGGDPGTGSASGTGGSSVDAHIDAAVPDADSGGACPGGGGGNSIADPKTCLVWQKAAGAARTNKEAAKYCNTLVLDGASDWRVPAPEELATWPNLTANSNAYITNPIYVPTAGTEADGCNFNSHSCNLTQYSAGTLGCGWQGVGFAGPTVCVHGTARPGTTVGKVAALNCDACKVHLTGTPAEFKPANCLPFAP